VNEVPLHPLVQSIAKSLSLEEGSVVMSPAAFDANKALLLAVTSQEKKAIITSLLAFSARLLRDGHGSTDAAVASIEALTAELIGDPHAATELFAQIKR
jgi:hypothetical protein